MTKNTYTFGDTDEARQRLRLLAELYEPETRELLQRGDAQNRSLAVDLGCGPGWSTRLLHETLHAGRTVGLDSSERYIADARQLYNGNTGLEFHVHDATRATFPCSAPNVLFCRFLLTHLNAPASALKTWASASAPGCVLFIHETESLETDDPVLRRYYELVGQLQCAHGQALYVGGGLDACLKESGWRVLESRRVDLSKPVSKMAQLHLPNLHTWRHDAFARKTFDPCEIDSLEAALHKRANGSPNESVVINGARQIIAQRE